MDTNLPMDEDQWEDSESEEEEAMKAMRVQEPRRIHKRIHRGKRVIIKPDDDSHRSFLSRSHVLATGYKKKIRDLLINNKMLAKALEEANLKILMLEKQLSEMYRQANRQNMLKLKMNQVSNKLTSMATILTETAGLVQETVSYTVDSEDTTYDMTVLASGNSAANPGKKSATGLELLMERGTYPLPSQMKPIDMSAIEEMSVPLDDLTSKLPPILFENDEGKEQKRAETKNSESRNGQSSSGSVSLRPSARRQSSRIGVISNTATPESNHNNSPILETPKTPPIQFALSKFKSNIPKPVGVKDGKKFETGSPLRVLTFLDKVKDNLPADAGSSSKMAVPQSHPASSSQVASNTARKPVTHVSTKQPVTKSKDVTKYAKNKKEAKQKAEQSIADKQKKDAGFCEEGFIPLEPDNISLNLRRCTFTVSKDMPMHKDELPIEENIPVPKINRLTIVKHPHKEQGLKENLDQEKCSVAESSKPEERVKASANVEARANSGPAAMPSSEAKYLESEKSSSTNGENYPVTDFTSLPNVTIIGLQDMSLTELLPKEIICNLETNPAIEQHNILPPSVVVGPQNDESVNTNKGADTRTLGNEVEEKPKEALSNKELVVDGDRLDNEFSVKVTEKKSADEALDKEELPSKVSMGRRNSRKGRTSGNPFKKSNCMEFNSDDIVLNLDKEASKKTSAKKSTTSHKRSKALGSLLSNKVEIKKQCFISLSSVQKKPPDSISQTEEPNLEVYDLNVSDSANKPVEKLERANKQKYKRKKQSLMQQKINTDDEDDDFLINSQQDRRKKPMRIVSLSDSEEQVVNINTDVPKESVPVVEVLKEIEPSNAMAAKTKKSKSKKTKESDFSGKVKSANAKKKGDEAMEIILPAEGDKGADENSDPCAVETPVTKKRKCSTSKSQDPSPVPTETEKKKKRGARKKLKPVDIDNHEYFPDIAFVDKVGLSPPTNADIGGAATDAGKESLGWQLRLSAETVRSCSLSSVVSELERVSRRSRKIVCYKEPPTNTKLRRP